MRPPLTNRRRAFNIAESARERAPWQGRAADAHRMAVDVGERRELAEYRARVADRLDATRAERADGGDQAVGVDDRHAGETLGHERRRCGREHTALSREAERAQDAAVARDLDA